jgi:hypothetical protein
MNSYPTKEKRNLTLVKVALIIFNDEIFSTLSAAMSSLYRSSPFLTAISILSVGIRNQEPRYEMCLVEESFWPAPAFRIL